MNKIFSLVRNAETGQWVVASELAKGRKKRGGKAVTAALFLLAAQSAAGQTVSLPAYKPSDNDGVVNPGVTEVSGGATVTLTGQGTQIQRGQSGTAGAVSLSALFANGQVVTGTEYADPTNAASLVVNTGQKVRIVTVPDAITGGARTVAVYDNANIVDTHATSLATAYAINTNTAVNDGQYINTRIGDVAASGGTLNVDIGNGGATDAAGNAIAMYAKQSSLFKADGSGGASSTIVWQGSNKVDMGVTQIAVVGGSSQSTQSFPFSAYAGTFAYDASTQITVNNAADLQAYNNFLVSQMQAGKLSPDQYDAQFRRAYATTSRQITYTNGPADLNDEVYAPIGTRAVIHASGAQATGIVDSGARLDGANITADKRSANSYFGAVMMADQGGSVINRGSVSTIRGGASDQQFAMAALSGGHVLNQGVVNVGYLAGLSGKVDPATPSVNYGVTAGNLGLYANGAGSTARNDAGSILNVAGSASRGMILEANSSGSNAGIINVGVVEIPDGSTNGGQIATGAYVRAGTTFHNESSGQIYLGRGPQYNASAPEATADVRSNGTPQVGVLVESSANASNEGTITLGSLVQGSWGMYASGVTGSMTNAATGVINVNGAASDAPTENIGLRVVNSRNVTNAGTINLNGVNGVGIKATNTASGVASVATTSGTINVAGTMTTNGLRNYGAWAEGKGAQVKVAGGAVNLSGDGAIGVHARGEGKISVDGGAVNFIDGTQQIGFFAHGVGSSVDINSAPASGLDVKTANSTLFRIEDGAKVNNNAAVPLIASGADSTALQVTGVGSTANLDNMDITVSGVGATALKVEGGATGSMSGAAKLALKDGATAVVVDNTKYDLSGAAVGSAQSTFTNNAAVNVLDA